jgi:hypothetical protein
MNFELPADLIDAARHVDVQAVEVVAALVAHLDSVLGPRFIGGWPSAPAGRGPTTEIHFQDDVRFAFDCDIAFSNCEFADPRLGIASLSTTAFIDDDRANLRRRNRCRPTPSGFHSACRLATA